MSLDRKIINRIEQDRLRIIPRWFFAVKEISAWLAAGVLLAISALALAIAIPLVNTVGRPLFSAPLAYVWLAVFTGFFIWGYQKLMQAGFVYVYRWSFMMLLPVVLIANIALGYAFYEGGQAEQVETTLEKIPVYQKLLPAENRPSKNKPELPDQKRGTSKKNDEADEKSDQAPEIPALRDEAEEAELPKLKSTESKEIEKENIKAVEEIENDAASAIKANEAEELDSDAKEMEETDSDNVQEGAGAADNGNNEQIVAAENGAEDAREEVDKPSADS